MALTVYPNSLSFSNLETEFGGLAGPPVPPATRMSISLSNYYSGGNNVPSGTIGGLNGGSVAIPTSGAISVGNFHGSQKAFVFNVTYSGFRVNTNVLTNAIDAGWNQTVPITINCTVASGAELCAVSSANYGLTVYKSGGWPSGSVMNLNNAGYITGFGGTGGAGEGYANQQGVTASGLGGGAAMIFNIYTNFTNNGVITGGGGGGGGGYYSEWTLGGGGGGGGNGRGSGGGGGIPGNAVEGYVETTNLKGGGTTTSYVDTGNRGGSYGGLVNGGAGGSGGSVGGYGNDRWGHAGGTGGSYAGAGLFKLSPYGDGRGRPTYGNTQISVAYPPGAGGYAYYGLPYVLSYTGTGSVYGTGG